MVKSNNLTVPLVVGFTVALAAAVALLWMPGRMHIVTGIVWGIVVAYLSFLLFYFLMPRSGEKTSSYFRTYVPGAVVRYVVMVGAFCAVVFWLRVSAVGVLIGAFAGMMTSTFVFLNKMRQAPPTTGET